MDRIDQPVGIDTGTRSLQSTMSGRPVAMPVGLTECSGKINRRWKAAVGKRGQKALEWRQVRWMVESEFPWKMSMRLDAAATTTWM